jgi:hypothetical protein
VSESCHKEVAVLCKLLQWCVSSDSHLLGYDTMYVDGYKCLGGTFCHHLQGWSGVRTLSAYIGHIEREVLTQIHRIGALPPV